MKYLKWVNKNCQRLDGKNVIVTGANSGIGLEVSKYLCYLGAHVIMACRSEERASKAKEEILSEVPNASIEIMKYDQSDFNSVKEFAASYKEKYDSLYALVNNAGIYHPQKGSKADNGYPLTIMTNFFGGYYLSQLMFPLLEKTPNSRLVFESSIAANFNHIKNYDFLHESLKDTNLEYNLSKLAIGKVFVNFSNYNDLIKTKVLMSHPGVSSTNIFNSKGNSFARWFKKLAKTVLPVFVHCPAKACLGLLKCVASKSIKTNTYLGPRGPFHISGFPKKIKPNKQMCINEEQFMAEVEKQLAILKGEQDATSK